MLDPYSQTIKVDAGMPFKVKVPYKGFPAPTATYMLVSGTHTPVLLAIQYCYSLSYLFQIVLYFIIYFEKFIDEIITKCILIPTMIYIYIYIYIYHTLL